METARVEPLNTSTGQSFLDTTGADPVLNTAQGLQALPAGQDIEEEGACRSVRSKLFQNGYPEVGEIRPVYDACAAGDSALLRSLVSSSAHGKRILSAAVEEKLPAWAAVCGEHLDCLEVVFELGGEEALCDISDSTSRNAAHIAARFGKDVVLRMLGRLNLLHLVRMIDDHGLTPAYIAAEYGHTGCIQAIYDLCGPEALLHAGPRRESAGVAAALANKCEIIAKLYELLGDEIFTKCDVDAINHFPPVHHAAERGHTDFLQTVFEIRGAEAFLGGTGLHGTLFHGNSAAHVAARAGQVDTLRKLHELCGDRIFTEANNDSQKPAFFAVDGLSPDCLDLIFEKSGIDAILCQGGNGIPIVFAAWHVKSVRQTYEKLVEICGCEILITSDDKYGTPASWCAVLGLEEGLDVIVEKCGLAPLIESVGGKTIANSAVLCFAQNRSSLGIELSEESLVIGLKKLCQLCGVEVLKTLNDEKQSVASLAAARDLPLVLGLVYELCGKHLLFNAGLDSAGRVMTAAHFAALHNSNKSLACLGKLVPRILTGQDGRGETPAFKAAFGGKFACLQMLFELCGDRVLRKAGPTGQTAAHAAALGARPTTFKRIVEWCGPGIATQADDMGKTPAYLAAFVGATHILQSIFDDFGASGLLAAGHGENAFFGAARNGRFSDSLPLLCNLLGSEFLTYFNNLGLSPLYCAAEEGFPEFVEKVATCQTSRAAWAATADGRTVAHGAAERGKHVALRKFCSLYGKEILTWPDSSNQTPAYRAVCSSQLGSLKVIMELCGESALQKVVVGEHWGSAVSYACRIGRPEILREIVDLCGQECVSDDRNFDGQGCVWIAAFYGWVECVQILFEVFGEKAFLHCNDIRQTAAHAACRGNSPLVLKKIISMCGTKMLTMNDDLGDVPFTTACHCGSLDCMKIVSKYCGKDVLMNLTTRCKLFKVATSLGHVHMLRWLAQEIGTAGLTEFDSEGLDNVVLAAAKDSQQEILELVCDLCGVDALFLRNKDGMCAVEVATCHDVEILRWIVQKCGKHVLTIQCPCGYTPAYYAGRAGHLESVGYIYTLLGDDGMLNAASGHKSVAHAACDVERPEVLRKLHELGGQKLLLGKDDAGHGCIKYAYDSQYFACLDVMMNFFGPDVLFTHRHGSISWDVQLAAKDNSASRKWLEKKLIEHLMGTASVSSQESEEQDKDKDKDTEKERERIMKQSIETERLETQGPAKKGKRNEKRNGPEKESVGEREKEEGTGDKVHLKELLEQGEREKGAAAKAGSKNEGVGQQGEKAVQSDMRTSKLCQEEIKAASESGKMKKGGVEFVSDGEKRLEFKQHLAGRLSAANDGKMINKCNMQISKKEKYEIFDAWCSHEQEGNAAGKMVMGERRTHVFKYLAAHCSDEQEANATCGKEYGPLSVLKDVICRNLVKEHQRSCGSNDPVEENKWTWWGRRELSGYERVCSIRRIVNWMPEKAVNMCLKFIRDLEERDGRDDMHEREMASEMAMRELIEQEEREKEGLAKKRKKKNKSKKILPMEEQERESERIIRELIEYERKDKDGPAKQGKKKQDRDVLEGEFQPQEIPRSLVDVDDFEGGAGNHNSSLESDCAPGGTLLGTYAPDPDVDWGPAGGHSNIGRVVNRKKKGKSKMGRGAANLEISADASLKAAAGSEDTEEDGWRKIWNGVNIGVDVCGEAEAGAAIVWDSVAGGLDESRREGKAGKKGREKANLRADAHAAMCASISPEQDAGQGTKKGRNKGKAGGTRVLAAETEGKEAAETLAAAKERNGAGEWEEEEEDECLLCLDAPRRWCCSPCGHLVMCETCVDKQWRGIVSAMKECPLCRVKLLDPCFVPGQGI